jgi:hypothetical protein
LSHAYTCWKEVTINGHLAAVISKRPAGDSEVQLSTAAPVCAQIG